MKTFNEVEKENLLEVDNNHFRLMISATLALAFVGMLILVVLFIAFSKDPTQPGSVTDYNVQISYPQSFPAL